MNVRKRIFVSLVIINLLVLPSAYANDAADPSSEHEGRSHRRGDGMWKKIQQIHDQLNLSEEQKKQLDENKSKSKAQMKDLFEKKRSLRTAMRQELMKPELDMNKINDIQTQLKASQSEMVDHRLNSILEVRKILSPDQFQKFLSLFEKYRDEKSSKRKHRSRPPENE